MSKVLITKLQWKKIMKLFSNKKNKICMIQKVIKLLMIVRIFKILQWIKVKIILIIEFNNKRRIKVGKNCKKIY